MNLIAAFVMFTLTVTLVGLFLIPATYERRAPIMNFYWVGSWLFLALIATVSGAEQTVRLLGIAGNGLAARLQTATIVCFPLFVAFAWARLSGVALLAGLRRLKV